VCPVAAQPDAKKKSAKDQSKSVLPMVKDCAAQIRLLVSVMVVIATECSVYTPAKIILRLHEIEACNYAAWF
jgi:hypothetical protein